MQGADVDNEGRVRFVPAPGGRGTEVHVDLQRVLENEKIRINLPIHFLNESTSPGVKTQGGVVSHMRTEETEVLPVAQKRLSEADWAQLNAAFQAHRDPLASAERDPAYDRLFTRIVMRAPAPIGVGPA